MIKLSRPSAASLALGLSASVFLAALIAFPSCMYTSIPVARTVLPRTSITEVSAGLSYEDVYKATYSNDEFGSHLISEGYTQNFGSIGWLYQGFSLGTNFEIGAMVSGIKLSADATSSSSSFDLILKWDPMPDGGLVHLVPFTNFVGLGSALIVTPTKSLELFGSASIGIVSEASLGLRFSPNQWLHVGLSANVHPQYTLYTSTMRPVVAAILSASIILPARPERTPDK
jgi:hypothetical protein